MIGFLFHHWAWVAAGIVALFGAGLVFSPTAVLAVLGKVRKAASEWLRKDHDWWKIGCITGYVVIALLTASNASLRADVKEAKTFNSERVNALKDSLRTQEQMTKANADSLAECSAKLADEVGRQQDIEKERRDAMLRLREAQAQADRDLDEWRKRYAARPLKCTEALNALEAACPTLTDY